MNLLTHTLGYVSLYKVIYANNWIGDPQATGIAINDIQNKEVPVFFYTATLLKKEIFMNIIVLANIISLIGAIIMVLIGFVKDNKKVLAGQCVQFTLMGVANFILGAITGSISNVLSIIRNVYSINRPMSLAVKTALSGLQIGLSLYAGIDGLIGWLPIISNTIFTFTCDSKDQAFFKLSVIITGAMWIFYDFYYMNFTSATFDILGVITNAATLALIQRGRKATPTLS